MVHPRSMALAAVPILGVLLLTSIAGASATSFTGSVSATGTSWRAHVFTVSGTGTLTAKLTWSTRSAQLKLSLARKNPDGTWTGTAGRSGAQPMSLTAPVSPGTWRLGVKALAGSSSYTLSATWPDSGLPPISSPPYLTLLFSRSEITAADNCVANDTGVARLDTVVAPEFARRGIKGTGTVETGVTLQSAPSCLHWKETLAASWDQLAMLRDTYGWSFVSHSRSYAQNLGALSAQEQWNETCGSIQDLERHSQTRGDGLFAYPNNKWDLTVQTNMVSKCFAFGRRYGSGVTTKANGTTAPYWQSTRGISGGKCRDSARACSTMSTPTAYESPDAVAAAIRGLQPNQWLTLQTYLLVTGSRPGLWDCTAPNWQDHWSNDAERYCWNDYQHILDAIPSGVVVTDPKTVAQNWGRTNYTPPTTGLASR
ncbi:MAG TPA: hypothetical protein VFH74_01200 [Gaiellales bacterium]|nr:hypothetical protein [Gaiellales bacterium]